MDLTIITRDRRVPDYLGHAGLSRELAAHIEEYYRKLGFLGVRAWVERDDTIRRKPIYVVRTNLKFDCKKI